MNLTMIKLAVEKLYNDVEKLKLRNKELELKLKAISESSKSTSINTVQVSQQEKPDELMNTKQVQKYLGICYNTLQTIIDKGLIKPIRVSQRRVRFTRRSIQTYINLTSNLNQLNRKVFWVGFR